MDIDSDSSYSASSGGGGGTEEDQEGGFIGVRALQPSGTSLDRFRLRDFELGSAFAFDVQPATVAARICLTAGARLCISAATIVEDDDESEDDGESAGGDDTSSNDDKSSRSDGIKRAVLTINTPGDAADEDDAYGDADETMTLWDYRRGDARTVTSLGIAISGPAVLSLGVRCRSKGLQAINVFGSVILDDQVVSYGHDDDEVDVSDGEDEDLMQQLMEEERAELEEDAADPVDIVPAHEDDEESSPDTKTKREKKAEEKKKKKSKKRKLSADNAAVEDEVSGAAREGDKKETDADNDNGIGKPLSKKQRKKLAKQKAKELAEAVAKEQGYDKKKQEKDDAAASKKVEKRSVPSKSMTRERRIEGGVIIRDIVIGTGTTVKPGRKVSINYEGTLQSDGSVFDKNKSKANPFCFRPGTGEVIKGLDKGMEGMKIGGERIITIPPAMAYGRKGTAGIPKNSTLIFTIKLLNIGGM